MAGEAVQPWERITWPDERIQIINRDWGFFFYAQKQQLDTATRYYDKSLDLKDDDWRAYYFRSQCMRSKAHTLQALEDARMASKHCPRKNNMVDLQICDCLYELNDFATTKLNLHIKKSQYSGQKIADYESRLCVVNENFNDTVGDTLGPFFMKNESIFPEVLEKLRKKKEIDPRPLWKILKADGKCDVLSILEKEEELLSPREIARRERAFKVFNETYLNKSWVDVLFLKSLRNNSTMLLEQSQKSSPYLSQLVNNKYKTLYKFLKMLHARSPLYNEQLRCFPNKTVYNNYIQDQLYRVQYQTRRNMNTILRTINQMRKKGDLEPLCKYVEEVMGNYVTLKTHRVMPWKLEFVYEVYNILALAFADKCTIPPNIIDVSFNLRKRLLYRMPTEHKERAITFVFGDRSTHQESNEIDANLVAYRKLQTRYERRMYFAKYDIEKCYLWHEMARGHLRHSRFDECISVAKKGIKASHRCKSLLWRFLNQLLILKAHATLHRIERENEMLQEAEIVAVKLRSRKLISFIEMLSLLNDQEVHHKRAQSTFLRVSKHRESPVEDIDREKD